ncbi:sodium-coupled monocarboxylate transporter 1-like isoform X2 [Hemicordylus capensis]|uniref:sodium-coupled monocarboxylate transporter 1-like isoform X2 n=1 Tax=Hemicordylus capensis TaxID=884348 RepID=UPI00230348C7|nr:sodium-coupled monocarboxylate transporter 1-like isoform X2 [Hemicordylus capensis]
MAPPAPPRPTLHRDLPVDRFGAVDTSIFAAMLLISSAIGIYSAYRGAHRTYKDFLMAGRGLRCGPVAVSLAASFMSAVTVLGTPAEIYIFGVKFGLFALPYVLMVVISAEVFLPVYYRLGISSVYEIFYTGMVIYSPSLALSQGRQFYHCTTRSSSPLRCCNTLDHAVTGIELWGSVFATGVVCIFYCTLGGFWAVIWTDVFQFVLTTSGLLTLIIQALIIKGGLKNILYDAQNGGRLELWDFNPDPLQRHTFWTVTIGGTFTWLTVYGINQCQVQRYLACKTQVHAKLSLYINLLALWLILCCVVLCGLSMYSIYKDCDPWTAQIVKVPDQLMPYLVLDILGDFPGITGLFVAGTYSATLSTVSSSINSLAAVTVEDFIIPYLSPKSEGHLSAISMGLNLLFGAVCLSMAAVASVVSSLLQASLSVFGLFGGPLLGVFSMGMFLPFANTKGAFSGFVCGIIVSSWVGIGSLIYPPSAHRTKPLHLSTADCHQSNWTVVTTTAKPPTPPRPYFEDHWYSLSYLYFSTLGTLVTFIVGTLVSLSTGGLKQHVDRTLLFGKEDFMADFVYLKSIAVMLYERIRSPAQHEDPQ